MPRRSSCFDLRHRNSAADDSQYLTDVSGALDGRRPAIAAARRGLSRGNIGAENQAHFAPERSNAVEHAA